MFDSVKLDAAVARDIGKTIQILFSIQPHLHDNGLDGLFYLIPANLCDDFCTPLRLMLDDTIGCTLLIEQVTQLFVDINHAASLVQMAWNLSSGG